MLGENETPVYALEGSVFNGGSTIQWIRDELGIISSSPECDTLAAEVPDSGGVVIVPAFTGLGAPYWDMYARGTIIGLTRGSNKCHIARAVLEAIAFQVSDLIRAMSEDSEYSLTGLNVDGGASVSDLMLQFQADMLNIPVNRPACVETSALGAAYLAGLAAGCMEKYRGTRVTPPYGKNLRPGLYRRNPQKPSRTVAQSGRLRRRLGVGIIKITGEPDMKTIIQRVSHADVTIDGQVSGKIGRGLLVLLGVGPEDTEDTADYIAGKIVNMRIFEDENQK